MSQFIVSARKYRPQLFSTVIGQSHITTTLKNAINHNQLAHAFLFCGPRGVGKTTCARILAKTINCENRTSAAEACNTCPSCLSFNEGNSMNIHELDGASNNSVEDIRSLVEQVRFAPQAGKYKVYIVDEVHMLTTSAFNAFLKTLEEPPAYAIFILATTEKHKILPTILSRCQIFDFKRITDKDVVEHLQEICTKENTKAETPALQMIAQKSEGCMRDALSIMDKIVSFTNGELTYSNTLEHLNILDADYFFKLLSYLLLQDVANALLLYDDINRKGFEGDLVLDAFSEFLRNLLVCKDEKVLPLLEVVESFKEKYKAQASTTSMPYIISALNVLNEYAMGYKAARNKRLQVELCLIKLAYLHQAIAFVNDDASATHKKKLIDTVQPIAFRNLPIIAIKTKSFNNPTATLLIEEAVVPQKKEVKTAALTNDAFATTTTTHKLSTLTKIRKQFAAIHLTDTAVVSELLAIESLQEAWRKYTLALRVAKNPAVQSFDLAELRITATNSFDIVTPNNLQLKFIEQERTALSEFLQKEFNNKQLQFSIVLEERLEVSAKIVAPLSTKEQFQKMIAQYPLVKTLKDKLGLELDY
jgi:DNA polymerase III subunit gamma/tau